MDTHNKTQPVSRKPSDGCRIVLVSNRNLRHDENRHTARLGEEFSHKIQLVEVLSKRHYDPLKHLPTHKPLSDQYHFNQNGDQNDKDSVKGQDSENVSVKARIASWYDKLQASRYIKFVKQTSNFHLDIIDENQHVEYVKSIVNQQGSNGRSWLFWVHGNNQTLEASLDTCVNFQKTFPVNLVLFAWPSRAYNPQSLAHIVFSGVSMLHPVTRILSRAAIIKAVYERYRQYRIARKIARKSLPQFTQAYQFLSEHLFSKLSANGTVCNLMVHSLGHYLLMEASKQDNIPNNFQFDHSVLHQADLDQGEAQQWLTQYHFAKKNYVTVNRNDYALYFSGLCNNKFKFDRARTRLGNGEVQSCEDFIVIDFSDDKKIGWRHDILWSEKLSESILLKLKSIYSC